MKAATMAPVYAHLYPRLAEAAREHGYALALHGTLGRDLDLVAIPWVEKATSAEVLVEALAAAVGGYAPEMARDSEEHEPEPLPRALPHGRLGYLVFLRGSSGYIDVSVMSRAATRPEREERCIGNATPACSQPVARPPHRGRGGVMPDCGDNSCLYRDRSQPGGMRTNGGCRCDECPRCGAVLRPALPHRRKHQPWCPQQTWLPEHHRSAPESEGARPAPREDDKETTR